MFSKQEQTQWNKPEKVKTVKVKKPKALSIKSLTLKADLIFGKYIRLRDSIDGENGYCITCGKLVSNGQCGHFISRARKGVRWEEKNAHLQCPQCNCWGGGRQYEHGLAIDKKYGEGTAHLILRLSQEPFKLTTDYLKEIIKKFTLKIEQLGYEI